MCNVGGLARDTTRLILMIQLQSRDNKRPSNVLNKAYLLQRLASLISEKSSQSYSMTLYWLRCKLSFSLLRSAITSLRGSRSYHRFKFSDTAIDLACAESRLEPDNN